MNEPSEFIDPFEASHVHAKRERVFLVLAGLFLGSLTMLNILGVSRFIVLFNVNGDTGSWTWGEWGLPGRDTAFALAVGVLPYPITFLCTDLISEFYGHRRANWVVFVGLMLNCWVIAILWLGGMMPQQPEMGDDGLPRINIVDRGDRELLAESPDSSLDEVTEESREELRSQELNRRFKAEVPYDYAFYQIRQMAFGAVVASMIAYLIAQFTDVYLFHFWRRLTKGKHLWLRNNGSTLVSQLVDTVAVILITHFFAKSLPVAEGLSSDEVWSVLFLSFILPGYVFKVGAALMDTLPFYWAVAYLKKYLEVEEMHP